MVEAWSNLNKVQGFYYRFEHTGQNYHLIILIGISFFPLLRHFFRFWNFLYCGITGQQRKLNPPRYLILLLPFKRSAYFCFEFVFFLWIFAIVDSLLVSFLFQRMIPYFIKNTSFYFNLIKAITYAHCNIPFTFMENKNQLRCFKLFSSCSS